MERRAGSGAGRGGSRRRLARHNLDEYNSRFSPLGEIDRSNVGSLELKWSLQTDVTMRVGEVTPLVVDYFHSGSALFAVDAATGERLFQYKADTGIRSSPATFRAGGAQYVAVIAANTVLTFGLPQQPVAKPRCIRTLMHHA